MPKISVIVPVYNTEKYLPKCLNSLVGQTLKDIEIICINDCSTDDSLQILQKYAADDNRIKIIEFPENKGAAVARNKGIDEAKGEYIGFVDSDDFVDLDFYEKLYNKALETGADVVKGNVYDYYPENHTYELTLFYDINHRIRRNTTFFLYGFTSAIYRADFIKQNQILFPEGISYFEDPYFSISVTLNKPKINFVDNARYCYVRHKDSTVSKCKNMDSCQNFVKSVYLIFDMVQNSPIDSENYDIYVCFLMEHLIPWAHDMVLPDEANVEICNALCFLLNQAKGGLSEILPAYFLGLKAKKKDALQNKQLLLQQLRRKLS